MHGGGLETWCHRQHERFANCNIHKRRPNVDVAQADCQEVSLSVGDILHGVHVHLRDPQASANVWRTQLFGRRLGLRDTSAVSCDVLAHVADAARAAGVLET